MNTLKRRAIVLSLVEALRRNESWCGETNIQKAAYFLEEAVGVPLDYNFVLYKYGPYSFELTDELTALQADEILSLRLRDPRYRPSYSPGRMSVFVHKRLPNTIAKYRRQVEFVAGKLGSCNIKELERLATALYVLRENRRKSTRDKGDRIRELKPHISELEAREAMRKVDEILEEAVSVAIK